MRNFTSIFILKIFFFCKGNFPTYISPHHKNILLLAYFIINSVIQQVSDCLLEQSSKCNSKYIKDLELWLRLVPCQLFLIQTLKNPSHFTITPVKFFFLKREERIWERMSFLGKSFPKFLILLCI